MQELKAKKCAPIKGRVHKYLKAKKIKLDVFFQEAGISPSAFKGIAMESEFGGAVLTKVILMFPQMSARWLLTGLGEMEVSNPYRIGATISNNTMGDNNIVALGNSMSDVIRKSSEEERVNYPDNRMIALLNSQCEEKDRQISEKDKQIDSLLKTIALLSSK